jgi:hypothetical protein
VPLGGVGTSGSGKFHGRSGFDMFTNFKGVCMVPIDEGYEAMTEVRYATGDLEGKYQLLK